MIIPYGKLLFKTTSIARVLVFLIPFSVLGLFWYIRNYLAVGNPIWPLCFLWFPCKNLYGAHAQMWDTTLKYPIIMFNAIFGEYKLWFLSILMIPFAIYLKIRKEKIYPSKILVLCFIGFVNFLLLGVAPTSAQPWIMVSSFRYSYPVFIPLILSLFLLATFYKKEGWIGYFAIANMLPVLTMVFFPKLIFFYLLLAIICFFYLAKFEKKFMVMNKEVLGKKRK